MSKVLIIDGLNMFIRSYIVNPQMDKHGNPIGGCIGFLKSLQKVCRKFQPKEVVVVWDGHEGSQRKRALNKEYKEKTYKNFLLIYRNIRYKPFENIIVKFSSSYIILR